MVMAPDRATDHAVAEQHVRLARMLGQSKGRVSERVMYYRKPNHGPEAGWIVMNGTNPERQIGLYAKGFVPLERYGFVDPQGVYVPEHIDENRNHAYRVWSKILTTPGGPEEFPVDQLIQYRWYDPNRCPVPGVRFPQLAGEAIKRYWCPECGNEYFHEPLGLGRHLRAVHEYDRTEIATYGAEANINFAKELLGGKTAVDAFAYDLPAEQEQAAPEITIEMDDVRVAGPRRRRDGGL